VEPEQQEGSAKRDDTTLLKQQAVQLASLTQKTQFFALDELNHSVSFLTLFSSRFSFRVFWGFFFVGGFEF
jgi:hypothetical protein